MTVVDRLLNLNEPLEVTKIINNLIQVRYRSCDIKDGIMLIGVYGVADTFEDACSDYFNQISGKTLVFNATCENRREVKVL